MFLDSNADDEDLKEGCAAAPPRSNEPPKPRRICMHIYIYTHILPTSPMLRWNYVEDVYHEGWEGLPLIPTHEPRSYKTPIPTFAVFVWGSDKGPSLGILLEGGYHLTRPSSMTAGAQLRVYLNLKLRT